MGRVYVKPFPVGWVSLYNILYYIIGYFLKRCLEAGNWEREIQKAHRGQDVRAHQRPPTPTLPLPERRAGSDFKVSGLRWICGGAG